MSREKRSFIFLKSSYCHLNYDEVFNFVGILPFSWLTWLLKDQLMNSESLICIQFKSITLKTQNRLFFFFNKLAHFWRAAKTESLDYANLFLWEIKVWKIHLPKYKNVGFLRERQNNTSLNNRAQEGRGNLTYRAFPLEPGQCCAQNIRYMI